MDPEPVVMIPLGKGRSGHLKYVQRTACDVEVKIRAMSLPVREDQGQLETMEVRKREEITLRPSDRARPAITSILEFSIP